MATLGLVRSSVGPLAPHIVLCPAGQVVLGVLGAEDHEVVEVLEIGNGLAFHTTWHPGDLQARPLQAAACEVGLSGLIGVDDVADVVEYLGRTVPRSIGSEWRSLRSRWLSALPHVGAFSLLGSGTSNGWAGTDRARLPPDASQTSELDWNALAARY